MSDKLDSVTSSFNVLLGAITGTVLSWGGEIIFTILISAIGAATATLISHFVKRLLKKDT